jgi:hypothetical protein
MKLILIALLFSFCAQASFDLNTSLSGRSDPSLGGSAVIDLGYSLPLWGTPSEGNPMFGIIRASVSARSAVVVTDYDSEITFYPISFIGFGAGQKVMKSEYKEFSYYDCENVRCEGELRKDYKFAKLAFGYGRLISYFKYTDFRNSYTDEDGKNQGVAEYEDVVIASPKNDTNSKQSYFLGFNLGDTQIGFVSDNAKYHDSQQYYKMNLLLYHKKIDKFSYTFGIGGLESSHQTPGTIIIYKLNYEFFQSLALF